MVPSKSVPRRGDDDGCPAWAVEEQGHERGLAGGRAMAERQGWFLQERTEETE